MTFPRRDFSLKFSTFFPRMCKTFGDRKRRVSGKALYYLSTYPHVANVSPNAVQKSVVIRNLSNRENTVDNVTPPRNDRCYEVYNHLFSTFPHSYLWTLDNIHFIFTE